MRQISENTHSLASKCIPEIVIRFNCPNQSSNRLFECIGINVNKRRSKPSARLEYVVGYLHFGLCQPVSVFYLFAALFFSGCTADVVINGIPSSAYMVVRGSQCNSMWPVYSRTEIQGQKAETNLEHSLCTMHRLNEPRRRPEGHFERGAPHFRCALNIALQKVYAQIHSWKHKGRWGDSNYYGTMVTQSVSKVALKFQKHTVVKNYLKK